MALTMVLPANDGDNILATNYNAEFNNILQNPAALLNPMTFNLDMNGHSISGITTLGNPTSVRFAEAAGPVISTSGASPNFSLNFAAEGTGALIFNSGGTQLGQITYLGQLLFGTLVTASVNSGDIVIANQKNLRGVDGTGSGTAGLIGVDSGGSVFISPDGTAKEIRWGGPLVDISGGSGTATLGGVGQTGGPSTLTQAGWVRMYNHANAQIWVPFFQ